jgi:hypothetical protein
VPVFTTSITTVISCPLPALDGDTVIFATRFIAIVGVTVGVFVFVSAGVFVAVLINVFVAVFTGVFVSVSTGVFEGVSTGVFVIVIVDDGVDVGEIVGV